MTSGCPAHKHNVQLTESERDYVAATAITARSLDDVVAMVEHILAARLSQD